MKTILQRSAYFMCLCLTMALFQNCSGEGTENTAQSLDQLSEDVNIENDLEAPFEDEALNSEVSSSSVNLAQRIGRGWFTSSNGRASYYVFSSGSYCYVRNRQWGKKLSWYQSELVMWANSHGQCRWN